MLPARCGIQTEYFPLPKILLKRKNINEPECQQWRVAAVIGQLKSIIMCKERLKASKVLEKQNIVYEIDNKKYLLFQFNTKIKQVPKMLKSIKDCKGIIQTSEFIYSFWREKYFSCKVLIPEKMAEVFGGAGD